MTVTHKRQDKMRNLCTYQFLLLHTCSFIFMAAELLLYISLLPYITKVVCISSEKVNRTSCERHNYNKTIENELQSKAGLYIAINLILECVPVAVLILFCGSWSDTHGRKGPMIFPCVGSILALIPYFLSVSATTFKIGFILIAATIRGIFGNMYTVRMAMHSYVSDCTSPETRSQEISIQVGVIFLGQMTGMFLSGFIQEFYDFNVILYIFMSLIALVSVLIAFLQESVEPTSEVSIQCNRPTHSSEVTPDLKDMNIFGKVFSEMRECLLVLSKPRQHQQQIIIWILFTLVFLTSFCHSTDTYVNLLFVKRSPFFFSNSAYSFLTATELGGMSFLSIFIVPAISRKYDVSDIKILIVSTTLLLIRYIWAGFMNQVWMVWLYSGMASFIGAVFATSRSLLSKIVNRSEIGKVFSLVAVGESVSVVLGPLAIVNIYRATSYFLPGFAYLSEAAVFLVIVIMSLVLRHLLRTRHLGEDEEHLPIVDTEHYGTTDTTSMTEKMDEKEHYMQVTD